MQTELKSTIVFALILLTACSKPGLESRGLAPSPNGIPSMAVNGVTSADQFSVLRVDQEHNAHVALPGSLSTTVQRVTQHRTLDSSNYRRHLSGYVIREAAEHPAPAILKLLNGCQGTSIPILFIVAVEPGKTQSGLLPDVLATNEICADVSGTVDITLFFRLYTDS